MNQFEKTTAQSEELFLPSLGVSKQTFEAIFNLVASHLQSIPDEQPMKKGGQKSPLRLPERFLFTSASLPHNPTFARLGSVFGLSESNTNKIYHQILDIFLKVVPMKSRKYLLDVY